MNDATMTIDARVLGAGDIRHILHALTFLKPGGKCAALCLDTPQRETALRHLSASWEQLPETTFAKEGTRVRTVLATFNA